MRPKQKPELKPEYESMTFTQVNVLLQQQKDLFTALVNQQQDNFQGFVQMIPDSDNAWFDHITKELQDVKVRIHFTQKEMNDVNSNETNRTL